MHSGTADGDEVVRADPRSVVAAQADGASLLSVVDPHLHRAHTSIRHLGDRQVLADKHRGHPAGFGAVLSARVVEQVHSRLVSEVEAQELGVVRVGALVVVGGRDEDGALEEVRQRGEDVVTVAVHGGALRQLDRLGSGGARLGGRSDQVADERRGHGKYLGLADRDVLVRVGYCHELTLHSAAVDCGHFGNVDRAAFGAARSVVGGGGHRDDGAAEAILATVGAVVDIDVVDRGGLAQVHLPPLGCPVLRVRAGGTAPGAVGIAVNRAARRAAPAFGALAGGLAHSDVHGHSPCARSTVGDLVHGVAPAAVADVVHGAEVSNASIAGAGIVRDVTT